MLAAGARPPSSVDFSDVFKQTSKLVQWSPDGKLVAAAVGTRLAIRVPDASTRTMEIIHLHLCKETIEYIEWSCDGQYVLCGMYAKGLVQIWAIDDPDWTCRINEGIAGLVSARWAPDGRHILTTSDFSLHLTVWSLLDRTTTYIKNPKPHRGSVAFSKDGEWMAAADRVDCKDYIGIYHLPTREVVRRWAVPTIDLESLAFSPDGQSLLACDSALQYLALMYAIDGTLLGRYTAYDNALGIKTAAWSPTGKLIALGSYDGVVRVLSAASFAPVSAFDHGCSAHWRRSAAAASSVHSAAPPLQRYREVDGDDDRAALDAHRAQIAGRSSLGEFDLGGILSGNVHGSDEHFGSGGAAQSSNSERRSKAAVGADTATVSGRRLVIDNALQLSSIERTRVDPVFSAGKLDAWSSIGSGAGGSSGSSDRGHGMRGGMGAGAGSKSGGSAGGSKGLLKVGVGTLSWSCDGRFIASKCDDRPTAVFVWDVSCLDLFSVVQLKSSVRTVAWDPTRTRLAIAAAGGVLLYVWSPSSVFLVRLPTVSSSVEDGGSMSTDAQLREAMSSSTAGRSNGRKKRHGGASGDAFRISAARWSPLGDSIMIMSPRSMCVCFMENSGGSLGKARSRAPPTAAASAENLQRQIQ